MRSVAVLVGLVLLGACGGGDGSAPLTGTALAGEALFAERVLAGNPGCITCHSLEPGRVLVGPPLAEVGAVAAERQPGVDAIGYLQDAILAPDNFVVIGYEAGKMPQDWGTVLTGGEIDALVSYLMELGA